MTIRCLVTCKKLTTYDGTQPLMRRGVDGAPMYDYVGVTFLPLGDTNDGSFTTKYGLDSPDIPELNSVVEIEVG